MVSENDTKYKPEISNCCNKICRWASSSSPPTANVTKVILCLATPIKSAVRDYFLENGSSFTLLIPLLAVYISALLKIK